MRSEYTFAQRSLQVSTLIPPLFAIHIGLDNEIKWRLAGEIDASALLELQGYLNVADYLLIVAGILYLAMSRKSKPVASVQLDSE